jgi:acetate kinase
MSDAVLVLNAGSSSIKFGLFDITNAEPTLRCKGLLDEQQKAPRIVVTDASGKQLFEKRRPAGEGESNGLFADIFAWIEDYLAPDGLAAVGHRIVHGGRDFSGPVAITDQILTALDSLTPLAPLHQPRCLAPVRAVRSLQPALTQIACFDTAFHHGLAPPASRLPSQGILKSAGFAATAFTGSPSNTSLAALPRSGPSRHKNARWSRISAMAQASAPCRMAGVSIPPWG